MFFLCAKRNEGFGGKCSTPSESSHVLFRKMPGESVGTYPAYSRDCTAGGKGEEMVKGTSGAGRDKVGVM